MQSVVGGKKRAMESIRADYRSTIVGSWGRGAIRTIATSKCHCCLLYVLLVVMDCCFTLDDTRSRGARVLVYFTKLLCKPKDMSRLPYIPLP